MNGKLTILITMISIFTTLLAGCSSKTTLTAAVSSGLSNATKLAMGTLKLEGTSQQATSSQATQLLTLWEGYQSLSNSDTASQVELEALVNQIESTMTSEQIKAIDAMDLTDQSVSEYIATLAPGNTTSTSSSTTSNTNSSTISSQPGQAGGPGGGPGGIPGGGGSDSVLNVISGGMATQSTPTANPSITNAQADQVNPLLIQALIQMLKTRSQTTG